VLCGPGNVISFIKICPCIPETGAKVPHKSANLTVHGLTVTLTFGL